MVWGGISLEDRIYLNVIAKGTLTAVTKFMKAGLIQSF